MRLIFLLLSCATSGLLAMLLLGCASQNHPTTRPATMRERQEAALRDPFSYRPDMDDTDVSGGELGELDKDALKKDVDHVLNP